MYSIQPDPSLSPLGPHVGWRYWVSKILRIKFKRPRVVIRVGDKLLCNPENVAYISKFLADQNVPYRILPTILQSVK